MAKKPVRLVDLCDECSGELPTNQENWIFFHAFGVTRIFCCWVCAWRYASHQIQKERVR